MEAGDILTDRDFGLQMRFTKGDIAAFYGPGSEHAAILAERRKWISRNPLTHLSLLPGAEDVLDETVGMAVALKTLPEGLTGAAFEDLEPLERCKLLGENWETDFLLMKPDEQGLFRLCGGCLCFPSHWDLREKLNLPMAGIHATVPGLNEALERQIDGFLHRIKPGISWERANWGLSRTSELNLHPARRLPRLDPTITLDEVWWRLEEQSLVALPESRGILFGIRVVIKPLREIQADAAARQGLIRALNTMPEAMANYKGIASARERLLELMEG